MHFLDELFLTIAFAFLYNKKICKSVNQYISECNTSLMEWCSNNVFDSQLTQQPN